MDYSLKKIVIIGASGFVGRYLYSSLKDSFEVYGTGYTNDKFDILDVTVEKDLEKYIVGQNPDAIIWLSGKDTSFCEKDPIRGFEINSKALSYLKNILERNSMNPKLIYISSDRVFNGQSGFYADTDTITPVTNYGFTKKVCEQILGNSELDYKIVRISAVFGKGGVFFEWLIKNLKRGGRTGFFSNSYFTPTPISLLCENIRAILNDWDIGGKIIHLSGGRRLNRFEFANMIAEMLNIKSLNIYPEEKCSMFADDLSLKPSECVKFRVSFDEYLREEIDKAHLPD